MATLIQAGGLQSVSFTAVFSNDVFIEVTTTAIYTSGAATVVSTGNGQTTKLSGRVQPAGIALMNKRAGRVSGVSATSSTTKRAVHAYTSAIPRIPITPRSSGEQFRAVSKSQGPDPGLGRTRPGPDQFTPRPTPRQLQRADPMGTGPARKGDVSSARYLRDQASPISARSTQRS